MEKLLDVIERKDALVIALSDGHIRAVDLSGYHRGNEAEISAEELYEEGKRVYTILPEDMEQLQNCEYIFREDAGKYDDFRRFGTFFCLLVIFISGLLQVWYQKSVILNRYVRLSNYLLMGNHAYEFINRLAVLK